MAEMITNLDHAFTLFLQNDVRNAFLNVIMVIFTTIGNAGAFWIVLSLVLMTRKRYRTLGLDILIVMACCYAVNDIVIKNLVERPRPFMQFEDVTVLGAVPSSWSFPSGHSCSSFASAFVITKTEGRKYAWFYAIAAVIAFSRIYVGVHYLTDVLAGCALGTLGAWLVLTLRRRYLDYGRWPCLGENRDI